MKMTHHHGLTAFSLIEVTLAIGVASFSLISILALLPVGLNSAQSATMQTGAMNVIAAVAADIRITSPGATASPRFAINPATTKTLYFSQAGTLTHAGQPIYKVAIQNVQPSPATPAVSGTMDHITVTWPALAPASSATGSVDVMVSLPQD
jgi:uncharacterized protein (TIGR02598 family)